MRRLNKALSIVILSFVWFLVLPFEFEGAGWHWLDGYYLLLAKVMDNEINDGLYHYTSTIILFIFLLVAVICGALSYLLIRKLRPKSRIQHDR
ncbi:MAG TPA: hypothetical protein VK712_01840 [Verrucomicrobiae bacterium]|jgi:hypothetical protein|nr:hypothetical protein [Verrucomicrobiae bacterium]